MRCLYAMGPLPIGTPSKKIWPEVIWMSPVIIFMVVDLPEPFGPRYPVTSPARAEKLTSSTAGMPEKCLYTPRNSSTEPPYRIQQEYILTMRPSPNKQCTRVHS